MNLFLLLKLSFGRLELVELLEDFLTLRCHVGNIVLLPSTQFHVVVALGSVLRQAKVARLHDLLRRPRIIAVEIDRVHVGY